MGDVATARGWSASGAAALTGRTDGPPLDAPAGIVRRIAALGAPLDVDPLPLLAERAHDGNVSRAGATNCGGSARLLRAADGWIAVNLARAEDRDSVEAWLETPPGPDVWTTIAAAVGSRPVADVVGRAALLALPVSAVGEVAPPAPSALGALPVAATRVNAEPTEPARRRDPSPAVVDLSSLWAGPLCGRLLRERDARVLKLESVARPDGARRGSPRFFDRMHRGSSFASVDFTSGGGRAALAAHLARADVVIEASRPRALRQLGIDATAMLAGGRPRVWVSITGYGRDSDRVAFGDDAAAAGGLVTWEPGHDPGFVADAIADPLSGVVAAAAATLALDAGGSWLIDVSMAAVAAHVAGSDRDAPWCPV